MKISQLINEDAWLGINKKGQSKVRSDRFGWNGKDDPNNNVDVHIYYPGRQNGKTKRVTTEPRSESPVGGLHITRKDRRTLKKAEFDEKFKQHKYKFNREIAKYNASGTPIYPDRASESSALAHKGETAKYQTRYPDHVRKSSVIAHNNNNNNNSKLGLGAKIAAGTAAVGGAAVIGKKLWNRHQAKTFTGKHGKKVVAGTLAALGAGIGVKALLKYLRKKKEQ